MQIIKETSRELVTCRGYAGVCHACGSPVEYDGDFVAILALENDTFQVLVPVDRMVCPWCSTSHTSFQRWKSVEVSSEFHKLPAG